MRRVRRVRRGIVFSYQLLRAPKAAQLSVISCVSLKRNKAARGGWSVVRGIVNLQKSGLVDE